MDQDKNEDQPKRMLQLLLDTIPIRVLWKDRQSVYLGCNRQFALDAGFSSVEEVVGKTDFDMPWKEHADSRRADDRRIMESGEPQLGYVEAQTAADGHVIQLRKNKVPLKNEFGETIGVLCVYEDITDRKIAEDQLRERESLYRTIFERSPFPVALSNLVGELVDINEKFVHTLGVPRDEAIGKTLADLGIFENVVQEAVLDEIARTAGTLTDYEIQGRTRSGEIRYALVSTALVSVREEPLILSIFNDVTERRQAEEQRRQSEEKYKELVENANSIILRWGRDGTIHFFNEFAQSFFGYTEDEIIGQNVMGTIVPKTETSGRDLQAMIDDICAHPEYHGANVNENMRKSGERVWIAWTNKPVFDEAGNTVEILSVGLDITQRIHDQQALQESEARYRSIFSSNVDAFLLMDMEGRIVDANARAAELYGYSRDELMGRHIKDIIDPAFHHLYDQSENLALGEWFRRESLHVRKDGTRFDVEVHGARLQYGGHERLLGIVFDVTERNRARESMQMFTNVIRNMQVGLYIYHLEDPKDDRSLRLIAANPASTTELGLSEEDAIGHYIDEVFPGLREQGIPQRFAEAARDGISFNIADFAYSDERLMPKHYSFRAFGLPARHVGVLFEDITAAVQAEEDRDRFYRNTIEAATEGKLIICDRKEVERISGPLLGICKVTHAQDVGVARRVAAEVAQSQGMDEYKMFDLALCVGEAATNALKHAQSGMVSIHKRGECLLVLVTDHGPGIQAINLPYVALKNNYTTAVSLGMGYKAMLSIADQVYLATGPDGTTVGIQMSLHYIPEQPGPVVLPDTW